MTNDLAKDKSPRFSFPFAPRYGIIFATYFVYTQARTRNLISYLSIFFCIKVIKKRLDFNGIGCLSIVTEKLKTYFFWHKYTKILNTFRMGANLLENCTCVL